MKLYLRTNKPTGMMVGFRDLKTGKVNQGYKLFFEKCDIDIPDEHGEQMLAQNAHVCSKTAKDLAPAILRAQEDKLQAAIKTLLEAGYSITKNDKPVTVNKSGAGKDADTPQTPENVEAVMDEIEALGDLAAVEKKVLVPLVEKLGLKVTNKDTKDTLVEKISVFSTQFYGA